MLSYLHINMQLLFHATNNANATCVPRQLAQLFNYHDIFLKRPTVRQIILHACGRQSVQSRLHMTVSNGGMDGG